jgi:soluble lytic murein transglycosylase-like protein
MARSECHEQHEECHVRPFQFPAKQLALALTASFFLNACSYTAVLNPSEVFSPLSSAVKATEVMEKGLSATHIDRLAAQLDHILNKANPEQANSANVLMDAIINVLGHDEDKIRLVVQQIAKSSERHDVPPTLLASLIHRESSFRQGAVSSVGARGLTQIQPKVWGKYCKALNTIPGNVDCGAKVLRHYYDNGGSWEKALAFYNVGPSAYRNNPKMRATGAKFAQQVISGQSKIETQLAMLEEKSPL